MPKHVGLGFTVHNIWRAKELVCMLNRHGHSISYEKVLEIDSDWGEGIQSMDDNLYTAIQTNTVPGIFTQAAADNADFNLDNLDRKGSVHITSLVLYQDKTATIELGNFLPNIPIRKKGKKRRSVDFRGGRPLNYRISPSEPTFNIDIYRLLKLQERPNKMWLINWSWRLCRMPPMKDFTVNIHKKNDSQNVPQWNGFQL